MLILRPDLYLKALDVNSGNISREEVIVEFGLTYEEELILDEYIEGLILDEYIDETQSGR